MWISAEHRNDHHLHQLSQPQQVQDDYEYERARPNGQVTPDPQSDVIYAVVEKDPRPDQGRDEVATYSNMDDDGVIYSDLNTGAGSHTVAPSDQLYANIGR